MARAPRALIKNWRLKLSALGLAVFFWALVQTEPLSQETFSAVPLELEISDTTWTVAGVPSPVTVELRLGGPAGEIIRLAREGTSVRVPITSIGSRDTVIMLQRDWVQLGQRIGLTVESLSPPTLNVSFEPAVTRTVPLAMRVQGDLPQHLAFSNDLVINPQFVEVRGPESTLQGLDSLPLLPFDLGGVGESDGFTLAVDTAGLGGASVQPGEAMLGLLVEPLEERIFDEVPIQMSSVAVGPLIDVEPNSVGVRLTGARSLVTTADLFQMRVFVSPESVSGIRPGEVRRVRLQVGGVPQLVNAFTIPEMVTVGLSSNLLEAEERNRP